VAVLKLWSGLWQRRTECGSQYAGFDSEIQQEQVERDMISSKENAPRWGLVSIAEIIVLVLIAAAAGYLRFHMIDQVPPGLNSDEAVGAVGALQTLQDGLRLRYAGQGGSGGIGFHIVALTFAVFGPTVATLRGTAAFAGVVSIVVGYLFTRELFWSDGTVSADSEAETKKMRENRARLIAFLVAVGLTVSMWHIRTSRVAFAAIGVPFLQMPAVYFLWRGMRTRRWLPFVFSGVFLAAVAGVYMSGAFVPVSFAAFFLLQWGIAAISKGRDDVLLKKHFKNLLICGLIALVLFVPMAYFYMSAPEVATERARQAIFTNPLINKGDPWGTLWRSLWGNLAAFGLSTIWLKGMAPPNLIVPAPVAVLFVIGLGVSLVRFRRPQYLFLVVSWVLMLVPSILSPDNIPHPFRALGAAPFAYMFASLGLVSVVELIWWILGRARSGFSRSESSGSAVSPLVRTGVAIIAIGAAGLALARPTLADYKYYMEIWPITNDAEAAFHVYAVELGKEISKETDDHTTYLLPRDTAAGDVNPNYTVMFFNHGAAGVSWVVDDETSLQQTLQEAISGYETVKVVRWKTDKHTGADPKDIIRYFLEKHGRQVDKERFSNFNIESFQMDTVNPILQEAEFEAVDTTYGGVIRLMGYAYGDSSSSSTVNQHMVPAGEYMWARLRFELVRETEEDIKASVGVVDADGHVVGQIDKLLINNILHLPASKWTGGEQLDVFYLVPILPATAPGTYDVRLTVYGADSHVPLLPEGENASSPFVMGDLHVLPDARSPEIKQLGISTILELPSPLGLTLVGMSGESSLLWPGREFTIGAVWRAESVPERDYEVSLRAAASDTESEWMAVESVPLAGGEFGTSQMWSGQYVRTWLDGRVPQEIDTGLYDLILELRNEDGEAVHQMELGEIEIRGWERTFELPPIQNQLSDAIFDSLLSLEGYEIVPPGEPGDPVEIVLFWRSVSRMDTDYTTFVHILDSSGQVLAQVDHVPGDGEFPTTGWVEGEIIRDRFFIPYVEETASVATQMEIGVYDSQSMERLDVVNTEGSAIDNRVVVPLP
jgi:hypothetical protein